MSYPIASIQAAVGSRAARRGAGFNPATLAPFLWFEADYGLYQDAAKTTPATADGHSVGAVVDRGSNGLDLLQSTGANRPTLKLNIVNGHPVLRTTTNTQAMSTNAFASAHAQPNTMFYVMKFAGDYGIGFDGVAPNRHYFAGFAASGWYIYAGSNLYRGSFDTSYHLFTVHYNGANSYLRVDGVQVGAVGNPGAQGAGLFKFSSTSPGGDFAAAFGVHDISDANRDLLEGWILGKYGPF